MKNEMPKIPNSNHKLLKKGTKLVLSAATFGVVAAGSFQGVDDFCVQKRIYGYPEQLICICDKNGIYCSYDIKL